jgi:hypothetical protein
MGQALVDPPDPLNNSSPAQTTSADDLLSQLAGDEIDRLLAESEGQKPAAEPAPASPPAAEAVGFDKAQTAAEIDALLTEAKTTPVAPQEVSEAATPTETSAAAEVLKEIEQNDAQRAAMRAADAKAESAQIVIASPEPPLPAILKPLEWLSSPLDACPDVVREAVGKIAIITMINALAVLSFVLIFRHHHH